MTHELSHEDSGDGNSVDRGQILLAVLIGLALIASVIMLLADSEGAMKIALLAALWAAIIGFFMVYRYRKVAEATVRESEALEQAHLTELSRLESEQRAAQLQSQVADSEKLRQQENETLQQIKTQLEELRTQLSELSGREWGYEPTMLHAEARRILELESEQLRQTAAKIPDPIVPEPVEQMEPDPIPEPVASPVVSQPVETPREVVDIDVAEEPKQEAEPRRRSRHAVADEGGGRRRRDERQGGLSVADLLASARKQEKN
ncbi:DUF6779 domain-containing protein [Corynebacterium callunae]|uniref:DUF6779 domain-containing protein n=1 Tax=Corynebacterium callunae DSM 20147 TaxID=1121353 RepID=M1V0A1_9CORY|nr:DUF6779 domain-containing protein [Corynebacterium callunae]AGG67683.1 hypothetical protein H924_11275 [Corynebacterium callunae DSM 20147]MCK2200036.1 hypothetical protein [Corynebacterium callunae]